MHLISTLVLSLIYASLLLRGSCDLVDTNNISAEGDTNSTQHIEEIQDIHTFKSSPIPPRVNTSIFEDPSVSPLDPEEAEESARIEEEELEEEIAQAEHELEEIVKAQAESELGIGPNSNTSDPQRHEEIKAKAVQNLMEIFGLSDTLVRDESRGPAPEFMIELYNTITDSSGVTRAKNPYNAHVVRSFMEIDSSHNDFFFFNISALALESTESVLEVELHLYRMPTPHGQLHPSLYLTPFYILSLYQVTDPTKLHIPDLHKLLGVHYVPALGSGWEVFNVKKAVLEWLSGSTENEGFLVAATSLGGDRVPVRFARRAETVESKQPILVLFNHDSHMANLIQQHAQNNNNRKKVLKKRPQNEDTSTQNSKGTDDPAQYTYETTTPLSSLENPRFHHSLLFQDSIRHPNSVSRFRSRRSKNETESNSTGVDGHRNTNLSNLTLTECGLHDLFVSFESIGWSSWIISPKGYNAHYCDGPCVFPLGKNARPTNHATVQSIINELNLNPGLSRPCCVPTTLLPISLLYYDDQDNVVLKQYVDMVAEHCGCH